VTLGDLLAAVREVLAVTPPMPSVDRAVPPITITIDEQMQVIEGRAALGRPVSFYNLLKDATTRLEVVVTLLALLELVKQLRVTMRQDHQFGDILIEQAPAETPA
jgi:segregation and condensation protein A